MAHAQLTICNSSGGQWRQALELWATLEALGNDYEPAATTLNSLLEALATGQQASCAHDIVKVGRMVTPPNHQCMLIDDHLTDLQGLALKRPLQSLAQPYNIVIVALARGGQLDEAFELMDRLTSGHAVKLQNETVGSPQYN